MSELSTDLVTNVKVILPKLTVKELREVSQLASKLEVEKNGRTPISRKSRLFYDCIRNELDVQLGMNLPDLEHFPGTKRNEYITSVNELVDRIDQWIERGMKGEKMVSTKIYNLYALFAGLVVDDLQQKNIVLNLNTILNNFRYLPGIFDRAFPNYLVNGGFQMLVSSITHNKERSF